MSLWIVYNESHQDPCTCIVEAEDAEEARSLAYAALLDYSLRLFPGCWGQRRRFSIIQSVEEYEGERPDEELPFIEQLPGEVRPYDPLERAQSILRQFRSPPPGGVREEVPPGDTPE